MADMVRDPEARQRMALFGSSAQASSPSEFAEMLRQETVQWEKALTTIGLKKN
jgi:tripartite-type tricarboxylate transporter receptor subunit TctC